MIVYTNRCSFLVTAQERNQRKRLGDALAAKSFFTAEINRQLYPDFEPPSPRPPPGPRLKTGYCRFSGRYPAAYRSYCCCWIKIITTTVGVPTNAGRGTQGRAARSRGNMMKNKGSPDRLRGQRLPCAGFFWSFSCRDKKRTYRRVNDHLYEHQKPAPAFRREPVGYG